MSAIALELAPALMDDYAALAEIEQLPLPEYLSKLLERNMRLVKAEQDFLERKKRGSRKSLQEILANVPDNPPMPGDEWPPVAEPKIS